MHVFIGTPCFGGLVTQRYMESVCNLLQYGGGVGIPMSVQMIGYDSLITRARNTIVAKFLDAPEATHLLFIDADIGFAPDQAARLLAFDKEVSAGMYPLKIIHHDQAVYESLSQGETLETAQLNYVGTLERGDRLQMQDGFATGVVCGAGFLMIKREAFTKLIGAYPETQYSMTHNAAQPSVSPNQYALFDCMIEPGTRHYLSEDYAFCHRWRAIGGQVWLDTRSRLTHVGPREFVGDAGARYSPSVMRALAAPTAGEGDLSLFRAARA